jgi:hypothetical protein
MNHGVHASELLDVTADDVSRDDSSDLEGGGL